LGSFDLQLRPIAQVTGQVDFANLQNDTCKFEEFESVTLQAHFTPSEQFLGLSGNTYSTEVTKTPGGPLVPFEINVPPGQYDIYLQTSLNGTMCQMTPRLFRRRAIGIDESVDDVLIPLPLSKPSKLSVRVKWPEQERTLDGWKVAIVDSSSGLVLSTQGELEDAIGDEYVVDLEYSSVIYSNGMAPPVPAETEVLRLSPPDGVVAPTLYAARVGLELFVPNEAQIELEKLPQVVTVVGQVVLNSGATMPCAENFDPLQEQDPCEVPFTVQIVSASGASGTSTFNDTIPAGMIAGYQTSVETRDDLTFEVELPTGEYRAIAIPALDDAKPWAIGEDTWLIGDQDRVVHGKTVNVRAQARVTGEVLPLGDGTTTGFNVRLVASPRELPTEEVEEPQLRAQTVLELTRRESFVPRSTSAAVAGNGRFEVFADAGIFHLSVRPEAGSGFAWLVQPNVVELGGIQLETDLGSVRLTPPVRYSGSVSSDNLAGRPVAEALIRAYVYVDAHGELQEQADAALSVLQVAETRADAAGNFELLMPSDWVPTD
jgi:hypothetical protein